MKFDTIIIGGGLAGLICGIRLQQSGQRCAIISTGQSALHFSSGSFDLLGYSPDGHELVHPLEGIENLNEDHPYRQLDIEVIERYLSEIPQMFKSSGINLQGSSSNHYRITPTGGIKNTWLTLDDFHVFDARDKFPWEKALVVNFDGFLDFYPQFIVDAFESHGVKTYFKSISLPVLDKIRENSTEMRSANIARVFESPEHLDRMIEILGILDIDSEVIVMPAVFGLDSDKPLNYLKSKLSKPLCLIPTSFPSVPGIRTQQQLIQHFTAQGGTHLLGDSVVSAILDDDNRVITIKTLNQGEVNFVANDYILATGSFINKGLIASPDSVVEPLFNIDVDYDMDRNNWYDKNFFNPQPYMNFGVKTDKDYRAMRAGKRIDNLYAIGSILSGSNMLQEGCGAGVSLLTAFKVGDTILSTNKL